MYPPRSCVGITVSGKLVVDETRCALIVDIIQAMVFGTLSEEVYPLYLGEPRGSRVAHVESRKGFADLRSGGGGAVGYVQYSTAQKSIVDLEMWGVWVGT